MTERQEKLEELRDLRPKIEEMFNSTVLSSLVDDWNFLFIVLEEQEAALQEVMDLCATEKASETQGTLYSKIKKIKTIIEEVL